ncbi:MAG: hypothetical protein M3Q71_02390 [Chloroflexota bacterium]|nr:hypothetical protein [Chloroflexota bacterium]
MPDTTLFTGESWTHWLAVTLSLVAAVVYLVIASPAVPVGYKAPPTPVLVVAGLAYLVGAALIQLDDRRLLILGAVLNPLVLLAYTVAAIKGHAAVDGLSLTSKAAQIGLEVVLLWLILQPSRPAGDLG